MTVTGPIIGIDPGFTGAIAVISIDGCAVHDMPVAPSPTGKTELLDAALLDILRSAPGAVVWLERVSAMPGQGVSSVFRFGQTYGAIRMAVAAAGLELRLVTPAVWKKHFGISAQKDAARGLASQRFPALTEQLKRKKDDGRAEALLIALYGAQKG